MKGQILLMSQIVTQETEVNLWEFVIAKAVITFIVVQNDKHLASFVDLILTSEWDPLSESVCLHTLESGLIMWIHNCHGLL